MSPAHADRSLSTSFPFPSIFPLSLSCPSAQAELCWCGQDPGESSVTILTCGLWPDGQCLVWALLREENLRKEKGRKGRKLSLCGRGKQSKSPTCDLVMGFHRSLSGVGRSGRFECCLLLNISSFVLSGLGWLQTFAPAGYICLPLTPLNVL